MVEMRRSSLFLKKANSVIFCAFDDVAAILFHYIALLHFAFAARKKKKKRRKKKKKKLCI